MNDKETHKTFVADSIQGVKYVMRQQLSQGQIGYLTRVVKIGMMNVVRSDTGGTYIVTSKGRKLLLNYTQPSLGSPAIRDTTSLCGIAQVEQQSQLNAHKVNEVASTNFDFISSLFLGRHVDNRAPKDLLPYQVLSLIHDWSNTPVDNLYLLTLDTPQVVLDSMHPMWQYRSKTQVVVIASDAHTSPV